MPIGQDTYNLLFKFIGKDETSGPAKSAAKGLEGVKGAVKQLAAAYAAVKSAQAVVELVKFGAAAERQGNTLQNLASDVGTSSDAIVKAMQSASDFTIDKMAAMAAANKALVMDVAKTPAEFERLTKVATALGRAMGQDAAKSIDDFITAGARQSKLIADNLGLMVEAKTANERWAASHGIAVDAMDDAAKKQAFLTEMLRQGETKMDALGDTSLDSAANIEQMNAAWLDGKAAVGQILLEIVSLTGVLEVVPSYLQNVARALETLQKYKGEGNTFRAWNKASREFITSGGDQTKAIATFTAEMEKNSGVIDVNAAKRREALQAMIAFTLGTKQGLTAARNLIDAFESERAALQESELQFDSTTAAARQYIAAKRDAHRVEEFAASAAEEATTQYRKMAYMTDEAAAASHRLVRSGGDVLHSIMSVIGAQSEGITFNEEFADSTLRASEAHDYAIRSSEAYTEALRKQAVATMELEKARLGIAMTYTDFEENAVKAAEQAAEKREEIETSHAEKVAEIRKKGQTWYKQIDVEGTQLELRIAKGRLAEMLARQADFDAETSDLARARTEKSIRELQTEIEQKTGALQSAHDGYVAMSGKNIDDLLEQENAHYADQVAGLEKSQADQEAAQKKSLGRMILQHFEAWVEMNLAADGFTKEEAEYVTRMRQEIAEEYGLVTQSAIDSMNEQEERWKESMAIMTGEAAGFFDYFMQQFNALPTEKVMRIRTELSEKPTDIPGKQHGGQVFAGQPYIVGEAGPELFIPSTTGQVVDNRTTQSMDSHDTYNFSTPAAAAIALTRKRRAHISRLM